MERRGRWRNTIGLELPVAKSTYIDQRTGSIRRALIDLENHQSIYGCFYRLGEHQSIYERIHLKKTNTK